MAKSTEHHKDQQLPQTPMAEASLAASEVREKLSGIIEVKLRELGEAFDAGHSQEILIPLTTLSACVGRQTANLRELITSTAHAYGLIASGQLGNQEMELVLRPLSTQATQSTPKNLYSSPSLQALVLLLEESNGSLSRDRWSEALQDRGIFNEIIRALAPQMKSICTGVAKKYGIAVSAELISNAQLAAFKLLSAYEPTKSSLNQYLSAYLPRRMIDELRAESRDRPQRAFQKEVEAAQHALQQRLAHAVAASDPAIAEELGISGERYTELTRRYLASRPNALSEIGDCNELWGSRRRSGAEQASLALQESISRLPLRDRKILELAQARYARKEVAEILGVSSSSICERLGALELYLSESRPLPLTRGSTTLGLSFEVLAREVQITGKSISDWNDLQDYIDGLSFFSQLKTSKASFAVDFKRRYCAPDGSFHYPLLPLESQRSISSTIQLLSPTIDELFFHHFYLDLFNLPRPSAPVDVIAQKCVEHGILNEARPFGQPFSINEHGGHRSRFFEAAVVHPKTVESNIIGLMRELYPNPDSIHLDIPGTGGLMALLGFRGAKGELAKWGLDHGVWPRTWPAGHSVTKGSSNTLSVLLQAGINGSQAASDCLTLAFLDTFPHIDAVTKHGWFAILLQSGNAPELLATAAIKAKIPISQQRPAGYTLGRLNAVPCRELAFFYRPEIVGFETARANTRAFIVELVKNSSDLQSRLLARALNATRLPSEPTVSETPSNVQATRSAIIGRGWPAPLPYQSKRRQSKAPRQ